MTASDESRQIAVSDFGRSFFVADRAVWVMLSSLRRENGELRFLVVWPDGPPKRMSSTDIASFDSGKRQAIADLRKALEALQ